jgi:tetratricopeptide (TPR) repeat protein
MTDPLWQDRYSQLLTWEADALRVLGQLDAALVTAQRQWPLGSAPRPRRLCLQARILRCQGRLPRAAAIATAARQCTSSVIDGFAAALEQAEIALRSGDPALCQVHLLDAAALLREEGAIGLVDGEKQSSLLDRIWAQRALALGHDERARMLLERCRAAAEKRQSELDGAHCEVLLAESFRRARGYEAAGQALHRALAAAGRSGDTETLIVGGLVQGRLRIDTANFDGAAAAFGPALALASEHGYGTYRIDLLVGRGALHLRRGELEAAEQDARDALAYAAAPGCGYVGGEADALHLLATALIATRSPPGSPRHDEALAHLTDELELRERMSDPTAPEVRWLLRRLKG